MAESPLSLAQLATWSFTHDGCIHPRIPTAIRFIGNVANCSGQGERFHLGLSTYVGLRLIGVRVQVFFLIFNCRLTNDQQNEKRTIQSNIDFRCLLIVWTLKPYIYIVLKMRKEAEEKKRERSRKRPFESVKRRPPPPPKGIKLPTSNWRSERTTPQNVWETTPESCENLRMRSDRKSRVSEGLFMAHSSCCCKNGWASSDENDAVSLKCDG